MARVNISQLEPAIALLGNEYFQILQPNGLAPPSNFTDKKALLSQFAALVNGQIPVAQHFVYAGPSSGADAMPSFRALVAADIPSLDAAIITTGVIPAARLDLSNLSATNLTSGTVPDARFPPTLPAVSGINLTSLNANNLGSGTLPDARFPATLPAVSGANLTNLNAASLASNTVPTARLGGGVADGTTFLRGDQTWAAPTATVADGSITYAKIQNLTGLSVMGRASNSSGVGADITAASDFQVLRRSGTSIGFGAIDLSQANAITNDLPFANLAQGSARSVLGVTGNSTADFASIQGTADQVLVVNGAGTALSFSTVATNGLTNNAVTDAKLRQGSARTVIGVTGNASSNVADIQGTTDQVLRVNSGGTALAFGAVNVNSTNAVTGQLASASMPALTGATVSAGATLATTATIDLVFIIGDGTSVISTGATGNWFELDFGGTFVQWSILAKQSGSISIDVWKTTHSSFDAGATHPVAGDKISASAPITFSSATKGQSSTLTGWTTTFSAGDVLAFNVASVTTCTQVVLSLKVTKTS